MTCSIFGPGLVGSFLGAAANAPCANSRQSHPIERLVELPNGRTRWCPAQAAGNLASGTGLPLLVCTRFHHTPWRALPAHALAAQNGLGQPIPVIVCFLALDQAADGVIRCLGIPRLVAPLQESTASIWAGVFSAWRRAGLIVDEVVDCAPAQWEKTILNATIGPLCLATGLSMAEVWAMSGLRQLVIAATTEGQRIATCHGVDIAPGIEERAADLFARIGAHRPSVMTDSGELPHVLGYLRRHAVEAIPALDRIAELVSARHLPGATS